MTAAVAVPILDMKSRSVSYPSMWAAADAFFEESALEIFPQVFPEYFAGCAARRERLVELLGRLRLLWDTCFKRRDADPTLDDAVERAVLGGVGVCGVDDDANGFGLILIDGYALPSESLSSALRDALTMERLYLCDFKRARDMRILSRSLERRGGSKTIEARAEEWRKSHPARCTNGETRVYFIRNGHGNLKIGITNDLAKRLRELSSATGVDSEFTLLGSITYPSRHAAAAREADLHKRFASCRVRGEWFQPAPELVAFIKEELTEGARAS